MPNIEIIGRRIKIKPDLRQGFKIINQDSNLDKQDQNLLCCHYHWTVF